MATRIEAHQESIVMTNMWAHAADTPDGPFTIITDDCSVVCSGWTGDRAAMLDRIQALSPTMADDWNRPSCLDRAVAAVDAYYQGDGLPASKVPTAQAAAPFHTRVRQALINIPFGCRVTYAELAAAAGNPRAARAAAAACASNRTALFVPCHRVVRSDGSLGGFLYGLPLKQRLLDRESR